MWGSAHHGALEHNYRQKVGSRVDLPVAEIKEQFAYLLEKGIADRGGEGEILWKEKDGETLTPALVKDRGSALVGAYQEYAAPRYQPLAVEREFVLPLARSPVPVKGRVDLEAAVTDPFKPRVAWVESETCRQCDRFIGLDGPLVVERGLCSWCAGDQIVDSKTSAQNKLQPDSRIQAWIYQLERPLVVDFHLAVKTKQPRIVTGEHLVPVPPAARTLAMLEGQMERIAYMLAVYGPEGPWPTHAIRDTWACGYCGFRPGCAWWQDQPWDGGPLF